MSAVPPKAIERARRRVLVLRAAYGEAIAKTEGARDELYDAGMPSPDGQLSYRITLVAKRAALESYMTAVLDFKALAGSDNGLIPESRTCFAIVNTRATRMKP